MSSTTLFFTPVMLASGAYVVCVCLCVCVFMGVCMRACVVLESDELGSGVAHVFCVCVGADVAAQRGGGGGVDELAAQDAAERALHAWVGVPPLLLLLLLLHALPPHSR